MIYRSKWHKYTRAVRVARRLALAKPDVGSTVNETHYRRYLWLVDRGCRLVRHASTPPLAVQCVRVRSYLAMRSMGWRELRWPS